jgi:hypothetical protein
MMIIAKFGEKFNRSWVNGRCPLRLPGERLGEGSSEGMGGGGLGTWPAALPVRGGGLTGAPGNNAARELLRDFEEG